MALASPGTSEENALELGAMTSDTKNSANLQPEHDGNEHSSSSSDVKESVTFTSAKEAIEHFCVHTTGHGFFKIAQSERIFRGVWISITLLAFCGGIVHLSLMIDRFRAEETNTEYHIGSGQQDFVFPDITICSGRRVFVLNNKFLDLFVVPGTTMKFEEFFDRAKNIWKTALNETEDFTTNAVYTTFTEGFSSNIYRSHAAYIISCFIGGRKCTINDMEDFRLSKHGRCVHLSPSQFARKKKFDTESTKKMYLEVYGGYMGSYESIEFQFRPSQDRLSLETGMFIYIHPPGTVPAETDPFLVLSRGVGTNVQVEMIVEVQENTRRKPCEESLGNFHVKKNETHFRSADYTKALCIDIETQKYIVKKCNCRSEMLPVTSDLSQFKSCHRFPNITWIVDNSSYSYLLSYRNSSESRTDSQTEEMKNGIEEMQRMSRCYKIALKEAHENAPNLMSACPRQCTQTRYEFSVIQEAWPTYAYTHFKDDDSNDSLFKKTKTWIAQLNGSYPWIATQMEMEAKLNTNHPEFPSAFCRIQLSSTQDKAIGINENLIYPSGNLLSDCGGIFGLWLGFSLITMCELLEIVTETIIIACRRRSNVSDRHSDHKVSGNGSAGIVNSSFVS